MLPGSCRKHPESVTSVPLANASYLRDDELAPMPDEWREQVVRTRSTPARADIRSHADVNG